MATKIQLRHDTSAAWGLADPILAEGEMGIETDTQRAKLGNGEDNWSVLPYMADTSFEGNYVAKIGPATESVQTIIGESGLKTEGLLESGGGVELSGIQEATDINKGLSVTSGDRVRLKSDGLITIQQMFESDADGASVLTFESKDSHVGVAFKPRVYNTTAPSHFAFRSDPVLKGTATTNAVAHLIQPDVSELNTPEFIHYSASTGESTEYPAINYAIGYHCSSNISRAKWGVKGIHIDIAQQNRTDNDLPKENFSIFSGYNAPSFHGGDIFIGGSPSRNTFDLWKSTLTEEQLEQLEAGTLVAPANVATPGDGEFARQWYYDQQDEETQALLDSGELEYPEHLAAATFTDTFDLGVTTKINLESGGAALFRAGAGYTNIRTATGSGASGCVEINRAGDSVAGFNALEVTTDDGIVCNIDYLGKINGFGANFDGRVEIDPDMSKIGSAADAYSGFIIRQGVSSPGVEFNNFFGVKVDNQAEALLKDTGTIYGVYSGISTKTIPKKGFNFYAAGSAPNYFKGNISSDGTIDGAFSLRMQTDDPAAFQTTYSLDDEGNQVENQEYIGTKEDLLSIIKDLRARVTALENA